MYVEKREKEKAEQNCVQMLQIGESEYRVYGGSLYYPVTWVSCISCKLAKTHTKGSYLRRQEMEGNEAVLTRNNTYVQTHNTAALFHFLKLCALL